MLTMIAYFERENSREALKREGEIDGNDDANQAGAVGTLAHADHGSLHVLPQYLRSWESWFSVSWPRSLVETLAQIAAFTDSSVTAAPVTSVPVAGLEHLPEWSSAG